MFIMGAWYSDMSGICDGVGRRMGWYWRRCRLRVHVVDEHGSHEVECSSADGPDNQESLVSHHIKANWTR